MITDEKGRQVQPEPRMVVESCYSGRQYRIQTIDFENGRLYCVGGHMLPLGLDYKLVKR